MADQRTQIEPIEPLRPEPGGTTNGQSNPARLTYEYAIAWSLRARSRNGRGQRGTHFNRKYAPLPEQRGILRSVPRGSTQCPVPTRGNRRKPVAATGYLVILVTRPEPTVRPPSRTAKPRPSSMAMGWISSTLISVLSPGITISVPSGNVMTPVTSVVRK